MNQKGEKLFEGDTGVLDQANFCHVSRRLKQSYNWRTKMSTTDVQAYIVSVHQQICCFKIPMNYVPLMQILHSFANINCKPQQLRQLQDIMILMQVIIQTSSRHILCKGRRQSEVQFTEQKNIKQETGTYTSRYD